MDLIKLKLSEVRDTCQNLPKLWAALQKGGKIKGIYLEISREEFVKAQEAYLPRGIKWGTVIHEVLKPATALIDKIVGTKITNCGGCAGRELKLNVKISAPNS